jgi:hypothetical protein
MRKLLIVVALMLGLAAGVADLPTAQAETLPGGGEGCLVTQSARCTYTVARRQGAYVANADSWAITVSRKVNGQLTPVRTYRGSRAGGPDPSCRTAAVVQGDVVDVSVTNGVVFVGDPQLASLGSGTTSGGLNLTFGETACPA